MFVLDIIRLMLTKYVISNTTSTHCKIEYYNDMRDPANAK